MPGLQGEWALEWGPEIFGDNSNLLFVASYTMNNFTPPIAFTVIRGTDISSCSDITCLTNYLDQDLNTDQSQWKYNNQPANAYVSNGAIKGLSLVTALSSNAIRFQNQQLKLETFLKNFSNQNPNCLFYVTGHSLGGMLATVLSPYLSDVVSLTVTPITFAAPTAGNNEFAALCNQLFPNAQRYQNNLDIIPNLYGNVSATKAIYSNYNIYPTEYEKSVIDLLEAKLLLAGDDYTQPDNLQTINGIINLQSPNQYWYSQARYQHQIINYQSLISLYSSS